MTINYILMNRTTYSEKYKTIRIGYPLELDHECVVCRSKVKYCYPDNGKLVHALNGDVYQIVNLYSCTNKECEMSKVAFNPSPKLDYSSRHFGADVFSLIAEEFLVYRQKPDQIHLRLTLKYKLDISIDTVRRMCDDILKLKSLKIDEKSVEIVQKQGFILLALDGQDPGGDAPSIWCFVDLCSNRILATRKFDSLDHETLRDAIEEIAALYGVKIIGWVSDKQNVITKCRDMFYPDIPHQYCQYHFLRNTWNHLVALDSNVYLPLKKVINGLYVHNASKSGKVLFENVGKVSVRNAFENTDADLQAMTKVRNKVFKELRGIWLYDTVKEYVEKLEIATEPLDPSFRFTKIANKTIIALDAALNEVKQKREDACLLFEYFQQIRAILGEKTTSREEKIDGLTSLYDAILVEAKKRDSTLKLEDCKSFLPSKKSTSTEIMGEWCRLWNSYLPGLFEYYTFPKPIRTNMELERALSKEKQAIFNRVAKANVCRMVATRGEDYLRITHCSPEELRSDILTEYSEEIVRQLREELALDLKKMTEITLTRSREYNKFDVDIRKYFQQDEKKKKDDNFVGKD